jgi:hypothetical protein
LWDIIIGGARFIYSTTLNHTVNDRGSWDHDLSGTGLFPTFILAYRIGYPSLISDVQGKGLSPELTGQTVFLESIAISYPLRIDEVERFANDIQVNFYNIE